jgi:signal transduction histidine kinase
MTIVMIACLIGLSLAGAAFIGWERNSLHKKMSEALSIRVAMIAENCKSSLAFQDNKDAEQILQSLSVDSSVIFGGIYDDKNELFAAYYHNSNKVRVSPAEFKKTMSTFKDNSLVISAPIVLDKEIIGTVCIQSDLKDIYTTLKHSVQIIIAVMFISLLAAFLVSARLQGVISKPILSLAKLAKDVSENKNYSARIVKQTNDEVGSLIDAFNEMLQQIQMRDSELLKAQKGLEMKVQERTTELSKTNEQLTTEVAERKSIQDKLEETNQELKNFVYIASHDLREPLRKISAFGGMLQKSLTGKITGDDAENLNFMIDGATRMTQMIEGLLAYSRVSTKAHSSEAVNLNDIVEQLRQLELSVLLEEKHTTIDVPQPLPVIDVDPAQIRQLMQNLIANGMKYQAKGNVPHITITSGPAADGMVRINVTDNGIGIAPEFQQAIFIMFKRLHSKNEYEGTGIGLAVCKKIVERNGGQIGVDSQPGNGSTFWFTVPAAGDSQLLAKEPKLAVQSN